MMHKVINGYTVVAHHYVASEGLYWILANRRMDAGTYEWVVAPMRHIDDDQWISGNYSLSMNYAISRYNEQTAGF